MKLIHLGVAMLAALVFATTASAHLVKEPERQIHHGATALLWLSNHPEAGKPRTRKLARRDHEWLFRTGMKRAGVWWGFQCIFGYETGHTYNWAIATNPIYDGGLQADDSFQEAYGPVYRRLWGPAYNWPWWAQLHMGWNGFVARGWNPWPNTGRYCGLPMR